jgi:GDP-L-fucose synthase
MTCISKTYIAGHTGLVGQAFVRKIQSDGDSTLLFRTHKELDLTKQEAVSAFFSEEKPDLVILAAAKVGGIHANSIYPAEFIYENLMIQSNIIHQSYLHGVKKLVYIGSTCAYPKQTTQPMKEESLLTGSLEPTNEPYAVAKIAGLKMCESYNRQYGTNYSMIMPTNLYGIHDNFHPENSHVIPGLMRRIHEAKMNENPEVSIWGSGLAKREFLFVDDLIEACMFLLDNNEDNAPINIGSQEEVSIRELAEIMSEVLGYKGDLVFDTSKPDGMPLKKVDTSKMDALGWKSSTSLREGLNTVYQWYLSNNVSQNNHAKELYQ